MRIGLSMIVKDEANRIAGALDDIVDLFDQVTIIDTGSTDGTPDILRQRYGIEASHAELEAWDCCCHGRVRNIGYNLTPTPWILTLDADERIKRRDLEAIIAMPEPDDPNLAGYFCAWNTHRDETVLVDYKLPLVRGDRRRDGLAHDNTQYGLRRDGLYAAWLDGLAIEHFPETTKDPDKEEFYLWQLECSLREDPDKACRYHWFLGFMWYRAGKFAEAEAHLVRAVESDDPLYPVERMNAAMVLAEIYARRGDKTATMSLLEKTRTFFDSIENDFEVRVNFRLGPWLDSALAAARSGELDSVRAYGFAC